jgi:SAM-dependent methyltransferase
MSDSELSTGAAVAPQANGGTALAVSDAYPIRLEPRAAFETLRVALQHADYEEGAVAKRLGGTNLTGVPRLREGRKTLGGEVTDANAAYIRLFIDGERLPADDVQRLLGDDAYHACLDLGLLGPVRDDANELVASVMLCPIRGLWLVSDRVPLPAEHEQPQPQDFVFSAINELTGHFLDAIDFAPGADVLEMCAGTGVAALLAVKRGAASAVAADITPRCVHFARFNVLLNGLEDRVRVVESDCWSALEGETFDLIVAHPPYVPALAHKFDFRDGGGDGESVSGAVMEGIPAHLRRGGRVVIRAAFTDRKGATIAQRIRGWLGASADEFDLVQLEALEYEPIDAYKTVTKGGAGFVDLERWLRHFYALGIERFAVCVVELRREAFGRAAVTERRVLSKLLSPGSADWHFRWAQFYASAGSTAAERLAGQTPRVTAGARLAVHLISDADGAWRNMGTMVETDWPAHGVLDAPPLLATLLELCDGTRELDALLAGLHDAGLIDDEVGPTEIANLVEVLAAAAVLELPACPLPPRPERRS